VFLSLSLLFPSREEEGKSGEEFFASLFLFLVASSVSACLSLFSLPLQLPVMRLAASLLALALALLAKSVSAGPNAICQWKPACVWWSWWSRNCLAKKRAGNAQSAIDLSLSQPRPRRNANGKTKKNFSHSDLNLGGTTIEQTTTASAEECCNKCASMADYKCAG